MNEPSSRTRRPVERRAGRSDRTRHVACHPCPSPPRTATGIANRIGRYDNPYLVAEWHRDPPAGTVCTPLILETQDRAVAQGWLYARGGESHRRRAHAPARRTSRTTT